MLGEDAEGKEAPGGKWPISNRTGLWQMFRTFVLRCVGQFYEF